MKNKTVYLAVRLSRDGYEWADPGTASGDVQRCRELARETDAKIPGWAKANEVKRIGRFDLVESR